MFRHDGHIWKRRARAQFEKWAQTYDQSILNRLLFQRCYLKFIELILRSCPVKSDRELRLLDIGCGTGTFAAMLAETSLPIRPVGLDMATGMCQIAAEKAERADLADRVSFVVADSEHLPMPTETFDVITCSNSFHHYPHQQQVLAQMFEALKPGGRVMIIDGFRDNVIGWFVFDVCVGRAEGSVHHCPAGMLREWLLEAGFEGIYQQKFGFWVPVLATVARKAAGRSGSPA